MSCRPQRAFASQTSSLAWWRQNSQKASRTPRRVNASSRSSTDRTPLEAEDVAQVVLYAVTTSPHVNVNEILLRPTD